MSSARPRAASADERLVGHVDGAGSREKTSTTVSVDVDLWPFVGAVVLPVLGAVALAVLAVYAVFWVAVEVRGAILRRRWRRARREAGQG